MVLKTELERLEFGGKKLDRKGKLLGKARLKTSLLEEAYSLLVFEAEAPVRVSLLYALY